jgi:hypothetical protein
MIGALLELGGMIPTAYPRNARACATARRSKWSSSLPTRLPPALRALAHEAVATSGMQRSVVLVTAAISLNEGALDRGAAGQALATGAVAAVTNTSLALIAVTVLATNRHIAWLMLVVAAVLFLAYRAYASLREQHEQLSRLHHFTRVVTQTEWAGDVAATILTETRELLRAERAALLVSSTIDDVALRQALLDRGIADAMVAPCELAPGRSGPSWWPTVSATSAPSAGRI